MRPLVVGPSPVITPSRTIVRASAAVLRQEIFDGSRAPIGSATLSVGADIGTLLFLVLVQHFHAGVNEWLTIRYSPAGFLNGSRLVAVNIRHGSGGAGIAT